MDIFGLVSIDPLYTYKHSIVLASIVRNFEKTVVSHLRHMKSVSPAMEHSTRGALLAHQACLTYSFHEPSPNHVILKALVEKCDRFFILQ